ncbi:hypothetical protein D9757_001404 [Collybiopsis confluens]|uniref:Uncharacterized protein n=1 Tax=Collybiopsis confluens TaxID=2823264 RepID=A0A8H5HZJ1_9AGAR|nr:hypothetical protein D9757_001404 [Collybiopsis confluens]
MLRCLQSTVQTPGGFRLRASRQLARPSSSLSATKQPSDTRRVNTRITYVGSSPTVKHSAQPQDKDLDTLTRFPGRVSTATLATMYDSVPRYRKLGSRQLSALIRVFGSSSLPPDAPRIANGRRDETHHPSGSFWDYVLRVADDKKNLGYWLNHEDHFWLMWAWIEKYRCTDRVDLLSNTSQHYHQIWKDTKFADILAPYFETLSASGDPECLNIAATDLCSVLKSHSHLHKRFLQSVWDVFLSNPDVLGQSLKNDILVVLQNRTKNNHEPAQSTGYLSTHMYNYLTKRHERLPLGLSQLVASLGSPIFPFFHHPLPISVQQWGRRQLRNILASSTPVDVRWANFSLFALYQTTRNNIGASNVPNFERMSSETGLNDWHLVLSLAMLERMISGDMPLSETSEVRSIAISLLKHWERIAGSDRPTFVSRAIVSSFLRIATRTRDAAILERCNRSLMRSSLWKLGPEHTTNDQVQVEALIGDHVEASIQCNGNSWADILELFATQQAAVDGAASSLSQYHAKVIIHQLLSRDIQLAYEFYEFCISEHIPIGQDVTTWMAVALAPIRPHVVYPMLERVVDPKHLERMLQALLEALRTVRYPYLLATTSARSLGQSLIRFLQTQPPPPSMKYRLRFPLPFLVASGRALDAVQIVELTNKHSPSFLSMRFLKRVLASLLRHRKYRLASRLHNLIRDRTEDSQGIVRRNIFLALHKGGAVSLAKRFHSPRASLSSSLSLREEMVRRIDYQGSVPSRRSAKQVLAVLRHKPDDVASIKLAFSILLRSRRPVAARNLLRRSTGYLDASAITWLGNLFLHRIVRRFSTRNIHVLRKIFRARKYLVETFGFIPDRVTFNIIMKALLHWKSIDPSKTRLLFDNCIRIGYPAGSHWRRLNNAPFGTRSTFSSSSSAPFGMSELDPRISFKRHVRPLYKMFVKAFYVRKDVVAAKTVVGILKNEEAEDLTRQQLQSRASAEGVRRMRLADRSKS